MTRPEWTRKWTLVDFADLVRRMRQTQLDFFRQRRMLSEEDRHRLMKASMGLEADVDRALIHIAEQLERDAIDEMGDEPLD
jgi:hypothetical protein